MCGGDGYTGCSGSQGSAVGNNPDPNIGVSGPGPASVSGNWLSKNYFQINANDVIHSPSNTTGQLTDLSTKILIYEDRVKGWFLDYALMLKNYPCPDVRRHSGFIILSIAVEYIEGVEQFIQGKSSKNISIFNNGNQITGSKAAFASGLIRIFNNCNLTNDIAFEFYDKVRCGLFHDGMTKTDVQLGSFTKAIEYSNSVLKIDSHKFLDEIVADFNKYIQKLKNDTASGMNSAEILKFKSRWENPP